ncbi:MAG TPA: isoprenylcysteine carboxylmethyltransferase family protein [Candidatus Sulfotelmatobacter sp.]|jgi:protein-S-isoprenylcysteine O-methyltransferase Ste14
MKGLTLWQIDMIPWIAFCVYWLITWLRVRATKTAETRSSRLGTIAPLFVAFFLLFDPRASIRLLGWRPLSFNAQIAWVGIGLTTLGAAIAIWARSYLGEFWSASVMLKEGHRIIRSGPYAFVRHPIYTGMLTAAIGTGLVVGELRAIVAVAILLVTHSRKAMREEALLTSEFGDEYVAYRRSTGFLFPRIWSRAGMDTHPGRS